MSFITVWVTSSGSKQKISNGSDDTQVHNGINDTDSDNIGTTKENSSDCRISYRSRKIYQLQEKIIFFMVNPTLGLESTVNTIQIYNISTNLDGNSHTNELQCPKVDCTATESGNHHLVSNTNSLFKVYHQNIMGLKDKVQEFATSLFPELPHI